MKLLEGLTWSSPTVREHRQCIVAWKLVKTLKRGGLLPGRQLASVINTAQVQAWSRLSVIDFVWG